MYIMEDKDFMYMDSDQGIWKETHVYRKRPVHMERDLRIWKETCVYGRKRPMYMERDLCI